MREGGGECGREGVRVLEEERGSKKEVGKYLNKKESVLTVSVRRGAHCCILLNLWCLSSTLPFIQLQW